MHGIVLVGGKGSRLLPHTREQPKALVKLGQCAILEIILRRLRAFGFDRITLCVAHLGEQIRSTFGDGTRLGLSIEYTEDDEGPLGTAAPLRLVQDWDAPAVVMNGDILTTIDFADLLRTHERSRRLLTVAFVRRRLPTSVGLVRLADGQVREIMEKPTFGLNVASGIYAVSPLARKFIPPGAADMPDLVNVLIEHGEQVQGYGFDGPWHDIGTPTRYEQAQQAFETNPHHYLRPLPADAPPWPLLGSGELVGLDVAILGDGRPSSGVER